MSCRSSKHGTWQRNHDEHFRCSRNLISRPLLHLNECSAYQLPLPFLSGPRERLPHTLVYMFRGTTSFAELDAFYRGGSDSLSQKKIDHWLESGEWDQISTAAARTQRRPATSRYCTIAGAQVMLMAKARKGQLFSGGGASPPKQAPS